MTSGGNRYPAKADLDAGRTGGCRRDLIARVSLMPTPAANATEPEWELASRPRPFTELGQTTCGTLASREMYMAPGNFRGEGEMRDRGMGVLLVVLVFSACTNSGVTTSSSPTQPAERSAVPPAIDDLVDVHGEPIDVSSLQGRIVFSSGTEDIYTVNADGSGLKRLTRSEDLEFDPTWSPDGRAIAYRHQRDFESPIDIFVMDAGGSHPRHLTGREGLADWGPDWSPHGEWIAWNTAPDTPSYFDLGLIHPDGTAH